jgi:hypothetical protein
VKLSLCKKELKVNINKIGAIILADEQATWHRASLIKQFMLLFITLYLPLKVFVVWDVDCLMLSGV